MDQVVNFNKTQGFDRNSPHLKSVFIKAIPIIMPNRRSLDK